MCVKIKLVTINVWHGGRLFDNLVAFLKKENPDIVVMQEVYDGKNPKLEKRFRTIEVLKKELGFPNLVFSPAFIDTQPIGNIEQGNAVFSKFPIVNQEVVFFDTPYGKFTSDNTEDFGSIPSILQHAIIALNNKYLNVFNVHGIWGMNGKDNPRRLNTSKTIISQIKNKTNVILAGDFNVGFNAKTIKNIENFLMNVFKDELKTTFNMKQKRKGEYATAVVDMVFVSRNIEVADHYCPQADISDHLPLVSLLKL